jgi:serine/threonine protein kinase
MTIVSSEFAKLKDFSANKSPDPAVTHFEPSQGNCVYWNHDLENPSDMVGGVILMKKGLKVELTETNFENVLTSALAALDRVHCAGMIHGDVRLPNMLYFDYGLDLIDFGMGKEFDKEPEELVPGVPTTLSCGGRLDEAGPTARAYYDMNRSSSVKYRWTVKDDSEMMMTTMYKKRLQK